MDAIRILELEEMEQEEEHQRRGPDRRLFCDRQNPLERYDAHNFLRRYRLTKESTASLITDIAADLERPTARNYSVPVNIQVCVALRFFATGSFQVVTGDLHGLSQPTVSRITADVMKAICKYKRHLLHFPTSTQEIRRCTEGMERIAGMPGIMGCIDGTHIPIINPGGPHSQRFINRKGWYSLNSQMICDFEMRFMDAVCRWYGSAHDSRVFRESEVRRRLQEGDLSEKAVLLGDSGYECTRYLLTPSRNPTTEAERAYNKALKSTRCLIERTFGIYKKRFPSVAFGNRLRLRLDRSMQTVVATSCLHNIAIDQNNPMPNDDDNELSDDEENDDDSDDHPTATLRGTLMRRLYITSHFN